MYCDKIDLYDYFNVEKPLGCNGALYIICHTPSKEMDISRTRPAMLVIPGGGYAMVSDREAEPVATEYYHRGFNAFVLYYSVAPLSFPVQIREAAMAMRFIRDNAEKYHVKADQVAAIGFSAGGHLCGCLGNMFDCKEVADIGCAETIRPNAVVLAYPVMIYRAGDDTKCHQYSFECVGAKNAKTMEYLSLENHVKGNSSPAFIWHTVDDNCVPVYGSLVMGQKYLEAKVPFEMHLFRSGPHGLSVCTEETNMVSDDVRPWIELSVNWLKATGFKIYN